MDEAVRRALERDTLIDITTTGRRTGQPRRIEIWFHYQDGRIYITSSPGPRGWYANVTANPNFTWHFKQSLVRDVPRRGDADHRRVRTARAVGEDDGVGGAHGPRRSRRLGEAQRARRSGPGALTHPTGPPRTVQSPAADI